MSTYASFCCLDLAAEADPGPLAAALREAEVHVAGLDLGIHVETYRSTGLDGAVRILVAADHDPGLVPAATLPLLSAGTVGRALFVIDGDEYGTQHAALAATPAGPVCVHAVQLVDPRNTKEPPDPQSPAYLRTASGLVDPGGALWSLRGVGLGTQARNGPQARAAAAALFAADPGAMEDAHADIMRGAHSLEAFWDTYGPWWKALAVPLPPWAGTPL